MNGDVDSGSDGGTDRLQRTFVTVFGSRDEAVAETTGWALGWLRFGEGHQTLRS
jgi:hypothetical protein